MIPDLVEKQCRIMDIKGIFLMPSCNNPTGTVMSMERKRKIASLIQQYHLILMEDDAYGFIANDTGEPIQTLIPDNTIYLHSLSKSLSAGLRCAYMVIPDCLRQTFLETANNVNLKIPLLNAEIISELIASGNAGRIIGQKKDRQKNGTGYIKNTFQTASARMNTASSNGCPCLPIITVISWKCRQQTMAFISSVLTVLPLAKLNPQL